MEASTFDDLYHMTNKLICEKALLLKAFGKIVDLESRKSDPELKEILLTALEQLNPTHNLNPIA